MSRYLQYLKALRDYSQETYYHSLNVAVLCRSLAVAMGINPKEVADYYLAGLLHDIGKTFIPREILFLPRPLERDEQQIVQTHVVAGSNYLLECGLKKEAQVALLHHERADGSGYPQGRQLEQIPLIARVVAVADSLAAMIERRSYRKAKTWDIAIDELSAMDNLYDPSVLRALITVAGQMRKRKQRLIATFIH